MRSSGAVTLREIALPMLDVACSCCERRGRLSVARLIAEHRASAKLPDLRTVLAGECPRVGAASIYERCGVHYPWLAARARPRKAVPAAANAISAARWVVSIKWADR
jgi:hypothetical protein